jgi:hypothetical protein
MNAPARTFEAKPAVRERVPLLIGLAGPSSSGKTKSALRVAEGIRAVTGGDIYGIDTEARRMAHYATEHRFQHVEFNAPFGSLDYLEAIRYCVGKGASVVIVDSATHEHEGPGGMIEFQERELDRLAGNDWAKRERVKMLAWQKPKAARRALINGLLQLNANFIFCFRAREKAKPIKRNGKTEIEDMGFMPIGGEEFMFEMTANCLLLPKSNGVPTWQSDHIGERGIMKMPSYLAHAFPQGEPLSEDTGRALAQWAAGGTATPQPAHHTAHPSPAAATAPASGSQADAGAFSSDPPRDAAEPAASASASRPAPATEAAGVPSDRIAEMSAAETRLRNAAEGGWDDLKREWQRLPKWMRDDASMVAEREKLKVRAAEVDAAREGE